MKSAYKQGFVSTARSTVLQEIKNPTTLGIWLKLKAAANYNTTTARCNGEPILLNRGAVVFSIKQMAEQIGMSRNTLRTHLGWLVRRQIIRLKTSREGSIAWLLNYDDVPIRKAEKTVMTHRSQQPCSKGAHPIRSVFSKSYNSYQDRSNTDNVPNVKATGEYLETRFEIKTDIMPSVARQMVNRFKEELGV